MSAVRHKASTRAMTRRLHEGGWTFAEIRTVLASEGVHPVPSASTLHCWVNDETLERQRRHKRVSLRRKRLSSASFRWPGVRGPEWKMERIRRLQEVGMTLTAISILMSFDFPHQPVSRDQINRALTEGTVPRPWREVA